MYGTLMAFLKEFFGFVYLKKNQQTAENHEQFPSMQSLKVQIRLQQLTNFVISIFILTGNKAYYFKYLVS